MRQCHRSSARTLTFSFTYEFCKQKYLLKHVPPKTRKCFCSSNLMHQCATTRTLHGARGTRTFVKISQNKLSVLGRDTLASSTPRTGHWLQWPPPSSSCPVHQSWQSCHLTIYFKSRIHKFSKDLGSHLKILRAKWPTWSNPILRAQKNQSTPYKNLVALDLYTPGPKCVTASLNKPQK